MAIMFPPAPMPHTNPSELQVFKVLESMPPDWVVLHDVWENYRDTQGEYINYEADFIVLIPHRGIVVIEVKGWHQTRIRNGIWEHKAEDKWISMGVKNSPLNQAWMAKEKLMDGLVSAGVLPRRSREQPEHRALAILTKQLPVNFHSEVSKSDAYIQQRCGNLPLNTLYVCGSEELNHHLQERIEQLFRFQYPNPAMSPQILECILNHLRPTILFQMDLHQYLNQMELAAGSLLNMLPMLEESTGGILVQGCAGSGKTYMALRELLRQTRRNAADGGSKNALFLCFSRNLAVRARASLGALLTEEEARLADSYNFHDLCVRHVLRPHEQQGLLGSRHSGEILTP